MLAGSILARGMLSARPSLEVGDGNFYMAHAGEQRATTRLFGPRRLGEGVSSSRGWGCHRLPRCSVRLMELGYCTPASMVWLCHQVVSAWLL